MKELRVQHGVGGRKGAKNWYEKTIALADRFYVTYLEELRKEGMI